MRILSHHTKFIYKRFVHVAHILEFTFSKSWLMLTLSVMCVYVLQGGKHALGGAVGHLSV